MSERVNGFYWVKFEDIWDIALYVDGCWMLHEDERFYPESAFSHIEDDSIPFIKPMYYDSGSLGFKEYEKL